MYIDQAANRAIVADDEVNDGNDQVNDDYAELEARLWSALRLMAGINRC